MDAHRCSPVLTVRVEFSGGLSLHRCRGCDRQAWLLDGVPVETAVARGVLRQRFDDTGAARRPQRTVDLTRRGRPARQPAPLTMQEALNAHLSARGLVGDWQVSR